MNGVPIQITGDYHYSIMRIFTVTFKIIDLRFVEKQNLSVCDNIGQNEMVVRFSSGFLLLWAQPVETSHKDLYDRQQHTYYCDDIC